MKLSKSIVVLSVVVMAVINVSALLILKIIPGGASCQHVELINDCVQNSNKISCGFVNSIGLQSIEVPGYCETLKLVVFLTTVIAMLIGVVSGFVLLFSGVIENNKKSVEAKTNVSANAKIS